ncbi:MAG TPA: mechanosensitive ion channel family protein [Trebonia sp.]|nr:mechanosensitive ion channel family protein [Trebonia sp.]
MVGVARLSPFGVDHAPATLLGSCDSSKPGVACRLVWDLTHNGRAATLTSEYLAGPLNVVLRVLFVVLLALVCQALVHRLIGRLTNRAAHSVLPQLRYGMTGAFRPGPRRGGARRPGLGRVVYRRQRHGGATDSLPAGPELAASREAQAAAASRDVLSGPEAVNRAAAQAEAALIDERRKQRVRALGAILRSASSVTIFVIAGFVVLGDLSINLAPLLASASVVGIALGIGAQGLVRDYLAGIFMLVEDQYGVGDVITAGNATGTVEDVTLRVTRVRDVNGIVWHIRNGSIEAVGNESQGWARAVIDFPVPFEADLATTRNLLRQTGEAMWNDRAWRVVMLEAPEVWGAQEISSSEVVMRMVVKTAPLRQWEVEREMRARVKAALHEGGIFPAAKAD